MPCVRVQEGKLFYDFRVRGKRCREYTQLADTAANRKLAEKTLARLCAALSSSSFDYGEFFPGSATAAQFLGPPAPDLQPEPVATPAGSALAAVLSAQSSAAGKTTPLLKDFAELWFAEAKVGWRATYQRTVRDILDNHLCKALGDVQVSAITRAQLLAFRAMVASKKGRRKDATLSPARVNTVMLITKQIREEAADRYDFTCTFVRIKALKVPKSDVKPFTMEEVKLILDNVRADYRTYFLTRFFTGMRTGEVDGLKWKYVDFENRQILIRETIVRGEEEYTKNDASQREIKMNAIVYNALLEHKKVTGHISETVFCNSEGKPLENINVTKRVWYPLLRYLGLQARRPYQTRHTAATMWLAAGENPEWITRQMGHANTEMLFTVYSRFVPNLTRRDGSALEKMISPLLDSGAANDETPSDAAVATAANDSDAVGASEEGAATPHQTTRSTKKRGGKR
ncbi:MAG: site-specific integrase [Rhodocyclaceae bacterium]|jgi:integrase|nr:site-specific integrase [Rhodocyclaceae bacterium]MCA3026153.1 site-specific integrase [Rhodocyclaceae bacterium]MCA3029455.1 site-specific integrase [Rhodocyclaceae bacterium]MCA3031568.1 site-specific integrase [Rhodocyclaceae bacterium]MCA3035985.1 site-specific integrase [Rhodocyclaceae bacterium]